MVECTRLLLNLCHHITLRSKDILTDNILDTTGLRVFQILAIDPFSTLDYRFGSCRPAQLRPAAGTAR